MTYLICQRQTLYRKRQTQASRGKRQPSDRNENIDHKLVDDDGTNNSIE